MRGIGVVALAIGAVVAGGAAASPHSEAARPRLHVTDLSPFTVHGFRFDARERLRVVIVTRRRIVRRIEATPRGRFTIVLRTVRLGECARYGVRVWSGDRLRAATKNPPYACGAEPGPLR